MSKASPNPAERAREKEEAREEDRCALAAGEKNREDLRKENGYFAFPNAEIDFEASELY